jgi:cytochrome b pre-mRNA-processing protein 3
MLRAFFRKGPVKKAARSLYDALAEAARDPALYGPGRVADTPDGRFELLALHAAVVFARLSKRGEQAEETAQEVFNILFSALDNALRELGVGDILVGKRIRRLAESFYGRMAVYTDGLDHLGSDPGSTSLTRSIATHVLEDPEAPFGDVLARRIQIWAVQLSQQSDERLLAGHMEIPARTP